MHTVQVQEQASERERECVCTPGFVSFYLHPSSSSARILFTLP